MRKDSHVRHDRHQLLNALRVIVDKNTVERGIGNFDQFTGVTALYSNFASGQYLSSRPTGICSIVLPTINPFPGMNIAIDPAMQK
jgi:hypothetical protein